MHEMGVAQQIADIVQASLPDHLKNSKVERIHLNVGELSGIVIDSLQFCFELAVKGTVLEESELCIKKISLKERCLSCGHTWEPEYQLFVCEKCQGKATGIIAGTELDVTAIDVEETEQKTAE